MLEAIGLEKYYQKRTVVQNVNLRVCTGEIVGFLGPNGAGKTTLFQMLVGLTFPDRGEVLLNKKEITSLPLYRRARLGLSYLPQEPSIFRKMTVEENIRAVAQVHFPTAAECTTRVEALLTEFNLHHLATHSSTTLSGGERRRLEIARALVHSPQYLLLDEPFSGIDPIVVMEIQQILIRLKGAGIGIFITDHNISEILTICDRTYMIHAGTILFSGTPTEMVESQLARELYLGNRFNLTEKINA